MIVENGNGLARVNENFENRNISGANSNVKTVNIPFTEHQFPLLSLKLKYKGKTSSTKT